jgi:uncharacterized protein YhbP (UPF0306 family)
MDQKIDDVEKVIRKYLPDVIHMSLATTDGNKPWVCEVHFVYDNDLNLYFRSLESRRHSRDIAKNSNVAGNIVEQHNLTMKPRGLYFEGTAELLKDLEINDYVCKLFCDRLSMDGEEIVKDAKHGGHQFYKISVSSWYLFDSRESKPSKKYHLLWGK